MIKYSYIFLNTTTNIIIILYTYKLQYITYIWNVHKQVLKKGMLCLTTLRLINYNHYRFHVELIN